MNQVESKYCTLQLMIMHGLATQIFPFSTTPPTSCIHSLLQVISGQQLPKVSGGHKGEVGYVLKVIPINNIPCTSHAI